MIFPGDTLMFTCIYDTTSVSKDIIGGITIENE
jgi:hypothetical protein